MVALALEVCGLERAAKAVRLSFNSESNAHHCVQYWDVSLFADDVALLSGLIKKGDSHAKVMRMVQVWFKIHAPRYWWAEFDTYKVGTATMSASTMHTLLSRKLDQNDFEGGTPPEYLDHINKLIEDKDLVRAKMDLPENFLQERYVNTNYQTLRHIYLDRKNHKLKEWHTFLDELDALPFYKEFIKIA
jgi:hypothetical protein